MAGLLDFFSGRSSDIYGEGLLTPEQRGGLGNIGLLALAGKLGQLAGPSFSPVPDFGAALGQAAGAYGASQEGAGTAALNAILTAQKGRKLQQELDYGKQLGPILSKLAGQWPGADGGTAATPETGSTGGGAAALLGAGGGGGGTYWTPEGLAALRPTEGRYDQIHYPSGNPSTATGAYGFLDSTWREQAPKAGVDINQYPRAYLAPPAVQDKVAAITPIHHWTGVDANGKPFNAAAQRLATNPNYVAGGASTAAAPAPAGGGGLLAVPAPNPLSDAEPMLPIVRAAAAMPQDPNRITVPPPAAGTVSPGNPQPGDMVNGLVFKGGDPRDPRSWAVAPRGAITPSGGGGPLAAPPGAGGDPIMSVTSADQAGGGEPPRAALPTMGPTGVELPPMQGPLAAPAAAAPAAPGPGLLSPPGAPAAALPRGANPAYDTYLRNLAVAGALAEGAGLKNVFGPLTDALKASPAYQAEMERAKARIGVEFAGPKAEAEKAVELRYAGAIAAAIANNQLPSQIVLKNVEAQNAVKTALNAKGQTGDFDSSGNLINVRRLTGADLADEQAKAAEVRGAGRGELVDVPRKGADGKTYIVPTPKTDYIDELHRNGVSGPGAGIPGAASALNGGAPIGGIVAKEYFSPEELKWQDLDAKTFAEKQKGAEAAQLAIQNANDMRGLIEKGVLTGAGSDTRLQMLRLGQALKLTGKNENDLIANTEAYIAAAGKRLKEGLQGLGPPISNVDVQTAERISGGQKLTVQSMLELMELQDKYSRYNLANYNRMAGEAPTGRFDRRILEPPRYGAQIIRNPATGKRMWDKDGQWMEVPF